MFYHFIKRLCLAYSVLEYSLLRLEDNNWLASSYAAHWECLSVWSFSSNRPKSISQRDSLLHFHPKQSKSGLRSAEKTKGREITITLAIQLSILSSTNSTCVSQSIVVVSRMPWACPPLSLSASRIMCQHNAALKLISSHRFPENTGMQLPNPKMVHLLSALHALWAAWLFWSQHEHPKCIVAFSSVGKPKWLFPLH